MSEMERGGKEGGMLRAWCHASFRSFSIRTQAREWALQRQSAGLEAMRREAGDARDRAETAVREAADKLGDAQRDAAAAAQRLKAVS